MARDDNRLERVANKARETAAEIQDEAKDGLSELKERAEEKWDDAQKVARQKARQVQDYAEDNPWQLATFGLVTGFILGAILFRRRD